MELGTNKSTQEKRIRSVIREFNHTKSAFADNPINIELYLMIFII